MRVEWHGQSAFTLEGGGEKVVIDPFGDTSGLAARGIVFEYPPIAVEGVGLLLVTHEHTDHNGVEAVAGEPHTVRALAGRHETPLGEVLGVASEHDEAAGSERGANTIFVFTLDGTRVAHFGDFGQTRLRREQRAAIGPVDLLLLPVGGGPTIGAEQAAEIAAERRPRWLVPMHYRTHRTGFLEPVDEFLGLMDRVERLDGPSFETGELPEAEGTLTVVPAAP